MAKGHIPVPVWNRGAGAWEPVDFYHGQRVVQWPPGFRQECLPVPEYQEGDRVHFVRDECCAREGTIRMVLFQGNWSGCREQGGVQQGLNADDIIYIVTARGHDHRVRAAHILGRFFSPERLSRVFPLQK